MQSCKFIVIGPIMIEKLKHTSQHKLIVQSSKCFEYFKNIQNILFEIKVNMAVNIKRTEHIRIHSIDTLILQYGAVPH